MSELPLCEQIDLDLVQDNSWIVNGSREFEAPDFSAIFVEDRGGFTFHGSEADPDANLAAKKESWLPEPSRFILVHEPPAFWYDNYYHWHYSRGATTITPAQLSGDGQKFISAILFVDGHSASHDFTHVLKDDPDHPMEPTTGWIWYKPQD